MGLGDDLHQGDARPVQVHEAGIRVLIVQALARILLQMQALDAHTDAFTVLEVDGDLTLAHDRVLVLADLVALGQVGKEIILPVEDGTQVDLGLQAQAGADRLFDAFFVDHRQHARETGIDERDLAVGLGSELGRSAGKELGPGKDLGMDLHADHDLPVAGLTLDQLVLCRCSAHTDHQLAGLALKSAAVSTACAARSKVASSKALPMSCRPSGRPVSDRPAGTEMPGRPARFTVTVKTSCRYISSGSDVLAPTPKAGPGVVG